MLETASLVNGDTLTIEDFNYVVDGTQNIYVKLETKKLGRSTGGTSQGDALTNGTVTMEILKAK